jgi:hypothetical protein
MSQIVDFQEKERQVKMLRRKKMAERTTIVVVRMMGPKKGTMRERRAKVRRVRRRMTIPQEVSNRSMI